MISPKAFHEALVSHGVDFFAGVPDSLLKEFCAYVDTMLPPEKHVIAANEGSAVALATGHYLATGKIAVTYLQNSGLGNTINPLLSLADREVYAIPMVILIGWRGAPDVKDEPQHVKQGRVTPDMLEAMEIPFRILGGDPAAAEEGAIWAVDTARACEGPVALLVHKGAFAKSEVKRVSVEAAADFMQREEAIALITRNLQPSATVVATTGMISRELYEQRVARKQDRSSDFLTVGSMGHASQIALGIARALPEADVVCLDGDGSVLMHMGGMATIGTSAIGNLFHIVLNNGAHDSVGGQPTVAFDISLTGIASACGYDFVEGPIEEEKDIEERINRLSRMRGRRFLEVRVAKGSRADLGRPKESPIENKLAFVARLRD